jgi:uncharacterized membrane protein YadS
MNISKFITPLILIFLGIMLKYSHNDGWSSHKKWWPYFIFGGILLFILNILAYYLS